jgi:hypothetical protein
MLASQLACPRDGHLEVAHCIFACLDDKHDSCMVFDPTCASIDMGSFKECEGWREFCGNVSKAAPPNTPQTHGKEVEIHFVC